MNTMSLSIGYATCALRIYDPLVYTFFRSLYTEKVLHQTPRVCVRVDIVEGKRHTIIDVSKKQITIAFPQKDKEYIVLFDMLRGAVSQFLPLVHTVLIHASVVVMNNKAYIFVGDTGAGKTTMRTLFARYPCYGDDTAVVSCAHGTCLAFPSPWYETSKQIYKGAGIPIAGIYFIYHGKKNIVTRCTTASAYMKIVKNLKHYLIQPYTVMTKGLPLFQRKDAVAITAMSETLARTVPCYMLGFTPNSLAIVDMILVHSQ